MAVDKPEVDNPLNTSQETLAIPLEELIGSDSVKTGEDERSRASASWSPLFYKARQSNSDGSRTLVDAVLYPADTEEVSAIVRWANKTHTPIIPVGGASNTTGSTTPMAPGRNALDLSRLNNISWDEESLTVTVGAGMNFGTLEQLLNGHGYTLGHLPQSLALGTVGGAVATNSIGILSGRYGRIGDMLLALEAVLPDGSIVHTTANLSEPFPDIKRLLLGSEGRFGIITQATFRIWTLPDVRAWAVFTFPDFATGLDTLRLILRSDARPAGVRLFDADAVRERFASESNRLPGMSSSGSNSLLILGFEGDELIQTGNYQMAHAICQKLGGTEQSGDIAETWFEKRHETNGMAPNARADTLVDTLAVAASWVTIKNVYAEMRRAMLPLVNRLEVQVGYAYPTGAALDFTFQAQALPPTSEAAIGLYQKIIAVGTDSCLEAGGSIAHHYGIGRIRRAALEKQQSAGESTLWQSLKNALDPNHILNPDNG